MKCSICGGGLVGDRFDHLSCCPVRSDSDRPVHVIHRPDRGIVRPALRWLAGLVVATVAMSAQACRWLRVELGTLRTAAVAALWRVRSWLR